MSYNPGPGSQPGRTSSFVIGAATVLIAANGSSNSLSFQGHRRMEGLVLLAHPFQVSWDALSTDQSAAKR